MTPKQILKAVQGGHTVHYTIRILRGYLHGERRLIFQPKDARHGLNNIQDRLRNFRFDEKPYDKPRWTIG